MKATLQTPADRIAALTEQAEHAIVFLDGAMGTEIQQRRLVEADFRGSSFESWPIPLQGNNDLLNLTRQDIIAEIHTTYLQAGAHIIETNTFSSTSIAQADYRLQDHAAKIAREGARLARGCADAHSAATGALALVAGAIGPTNKTLSLSPNVNDPAYRDVSFTNVEAAYREQVVAMAPFVDFFAIETVFDTLNAKAAIKAVLELREEGLVDPAIEIIVSGTITDASGRTLSGQTTEAFWHSIRHARPWAVGLNCALGADQLRPYVATLSRIADTRVMAYPNAGLPNAFGEYDETPNETATHLGEWAKSGLVNILGGCCGTTPAHIREIVHAASSAKARPIPQRDSRLALAGLEAFMVAS
jgi:5-methyltetrahydrofolate--homocysteine methyltransferase